MHKLIYFFMEKKLKTKKNQVNTSIANKVKQKKLQID